MNGHLNKTLDLVTEAILPMRELAQDSAEKIIKERIEETLHTLENEFSWDRGAMAPYPSSLRESRIDFKMKVNKYYFLGEITNPLKGVTMMGEPVYCRPDEKRIAKALEKARDLAAFTFDCYAAKLAKKVGTDVVSAKAESLGNDLWQSSKLVVYHTDGAFSTWNTNTIVNCSVLGKLFLQFPTRKEKPKK